jgi:hypothetical protein
MVAAGITKASLIRMLHATCPTLLLDEVDLLMKGDREAANATHQAINAGYRSRGTAELLSPTPGGGWENTSMRVFSPKPPPRSERTTRAGGHASGTGVRSFRLTGQPPRRR